MNHPNLSDASLGAASEERPRRLVLTETLLEIALQAQRQGSLQEQVREHPLAARWLVRHHLRVASGSLGLRPEGEALARLAPVLLQWLTVRLRPDARTGLEGIASQAWLQLSAWRPLLAMASYLGQLRVPDFPGRYRRRPAEPVLDNLCGIWGVGPSTVYRLLERARHVMATLLMSPCQDPDQRLALREMAFATLEGTSDARTADEHAQLHLTLAMQARQAEDPAAELWHRGRAGDVRGFIQTLRQQAGALSHAPETDVLIEGLAAGLLSPRQKVDLWLARADVIRVRDGVERELRAYEEARQIAQASRDPLLMGMVESALGKFYEMRDADRAFACYQDSANFIGDLGPEHGDVDALEHFITTYARLAWLYLLRNDPRSKVVLERAESLRSRFEVPERVLGMLEQVWGQYWRREGDQQRSLDHRFRALNIFERLGDRRMVLAAYLNIGFDLAARGDYDRATELSLRALEAAQQGGAEPEVAVVAHFNLGAIAFWKQDLDGAIAQYRLALDEAQAGQLRTSVFRARYNLAEAHYTRFARLAQSEDEQAGDRHVQDALAAPESDSSPAAIEATRALKAKILGDAQAAEPNRMLPGEDAVHLEEMSEVHRQREVLALPGDPARHVQAHLAIARAYAAIAAKEREAALALIEKHQLQAAFTAEFEQLRQTFNRELTREQHLADVWKRAAADIVDDTRRAPLIAHLLREGRINKSGYAELCGVSPATASKHLVTLAERGLLVQRGKGPSTRYELPT